MITKSEAFRAAANKINRGELGPEFFTLGISTSALFDMRTANEILRTEGEANYKAHMNTEEPLGAGAALYFVNKLLHLNQTGKILVNMKIVSHNHPFAAQRIHHSMVHHGLTFKDRPGMRQGLGEVYTSGKPVTPTLLKNFGVDLFLSNHETEVKNALQAGQAAGLVVAEPPAYAPSPDLNTIRFSFDFDRVWGLRYGKPGDEDAHLDGDDYYKQYGLWKYKERELGLPSHPAEPGPLAKFAMQANQLRHYLRTNPEEGANVEIGLVTANTGVVLHRTANTLREWDIEPDYMMGVGGVALKGPHLAEWGADIFFDDSSRHVESARPYTLAVLVPHVTREPTP